MISSHEIRAMRKALGETQAEFAERFGVPVVRVSRWENDEKFMSEQDKKIFEAIDVDEEGREPIGEIKERYLAAAVREMEDNGYSRTAIAKAFGMSILKVSNILEMEEIDSVA